MFTDSSLIFALDEIKKVASINNDNLLKHLYERPFVSFKTSLEKVAYNPYIDYMNYPQLKKKRKQLAKDYYEGSPVAPAIGGAIGAAIGGFSATKLSKLTKLKTPGKFKVPGVIAGGIIGAMVAQNRSARNTIRDLQRVDKRLAETKSTNIKKLKF